MTSEHRALVASWMREHAPEVGTIPTPGESWSALFERLRPPALVRAAWLLVAHHAATGLSVALPPSIAEAYLSDPDAYPVDGCEGCGYLLPARASVQPDGSYRLLPGWYMGICPVCERDNHTEEGSTSR